MLSVKHTESNPGNLAQMAAISFFSPTNQCAATTKNPFDMVSNKKH
jgi:hypothetical protein